MRLMTDFLLFISILQLHTVVSKTYVSFMHVDIYSFPLMNTYNKSLKFVITCYKFALSLYNSVKATALL
jgi:hypothetical protein